MERVGVMSQSRSSRHRVVVVGGGFGGLSAVKALRRADVDVTLIDRVNHHLFQPLLYQMATGILSEGDIAPPLREILRRQRNVNVMLGEVTGVDAGARQVMVDTVGQRSVVGYDSLILAVGSRQSYFGHEEFAVNAPGMKSIDDALEVRGRIFGAFEMAAVTADPAARAVWLTFVVVGAGPTGVEMAGQIAELSRRSLRHNFREIDPATARVVLLDGLPRALSPFPELLADRAVQDLTSKGVEIHLGVKVTGVDAEGIDTGAEAPALRRIPARTKIWAAGVAAAPLGRIAAAATGAGTDRAGRIQVQPDCTIAGHPEIFVVGDLMSLDKLPGVAEVAMQSARHAAATIRRRLGGDTTERAFRYRDLGTMATISRFRAIATAGPLRLSGFPGWLMWLFVHLMFLTGFKNRAAVLFNWLIAFIGHGRPQRAITSQQVFARLSLTASPTRAPAHHTQSAVSHQQAS